MTNGRSDTDYVALLGQVIASGNSETVIITGADIDPSMGPTIHYASPSVMRTSGYRPDELAGRPLGMLFPASVIPQVLDVLRAAAETREPVIVDQEARNREGKTQWLEISTIPVFDAAGGLTNFVRVGRDISARKKAEEYRDRTQRLLASVFGVVNEPLAVADEAGRLIMANTAVTRRLGWSIFDLMGKPVTSVLAEPDRAQLTEMMTSGTALDQTRQIKCFLLRKGKPEIAGEVEITSIRQADGQYSHVLTLRARGETAAAEKEWSFELAVREALKDGKDNAALVAGKLQLVGLDSVRESLGDRWPAMADRALAVAERTIQRHLRPGDIFRRSTDDGFLVLFSQLTPTEAQFKAKAIADEIREKLTGEVPEFSESRVASFTSTVAVTQEETASEETIVAAIERRLKTARDQAEATSRETLKSGLKSMNPIATSVVNEQNSPTPIVVLRLPVKLRDASESLSLLGQTGYELETETFLLGGAAARVLPGVAKGRNELVVTSVRMSTLSHARSMEAWLKVARTLGDAARRQIVAEVQDVPADAPQSRLADCTMRISSLFKAVAFEIPAIDPMFPGQLPAAAKLTTVRFSQIPWTSTGQPAANFCKLAKALEVRQLRLIVKDIASPAKQAALAKIGVTLFLPPLH